MSALSLHNTGDVLATYNDDDIYLFRPPGAQVRRAGCQGVHELLLVVLLHALHARELRYWVTSTALDSSWRLQLFSPRSESEPRLQCDPAMLVPLSPLVLMPQGSGGGEGEPGSRGSDDEDGEGGEPEGSGRGERRVRRAKGA